MTQHFNDSRRNSVSSFLHVVCFDGGAFVTWSWLRAGKGDGKAVMGRRFLSTSKWGFAAPLEERETPRPPPRSPASPSPEAGCVFTPEAGILEGDEKQPVAPETGYTRPPLARRSHGLPSPIAGSGSRAHASKTFVKLPREGETRVERVTRRRG